MRLLVTGATGLVGGQLLAQATSDDEVIAVARNVPATSPHDVHWVEGDLTTPAFEKDLPKHVDVVVHLAQSLAYRDFPDAAADVIAVNVTATARLLDYARGAGAQSFVLASTGTVYAPSDTPLTEQSPLDCQNILAASKRSAELLLRPYADILRCQVLRIFTTYGPGSERGLISDLVRRVREGQAVEVQGERGLILSPVFSADVAKVVHAAARAGGPPGYAVVNVGGPEALGIADLAREIGLALGREPQLTRVGDLPAPGYLADTARLRETGWVRELLPFADGIRHTVSESRVRATPLGRGLVDDDQSLPAVPR